MRKDEIVDNSIKVSEAVRQDGEGDDSREKISWQLAVSSHVTLKVYDVFALVNEEKMPAHSSKTDCP